MRIRRAGPADEPRIREIAAQSKGYWGYDEERLREWATRLDLTREIWLAEEDGEPIGWLALLPPEDGVVELDDLWVDPAAIGRGVGTELFRFACDRARERGGRALRCEAEPNAVGFYERMGAATIGTARSSWGRRNPVMRVEL
jgi:ribosomal protein S18 acetylase RimI-like enzyme